MALSAARHRPTSRAEAATGAQRSLPPPPRMLRAGSRRAEVSRQSTIWALRLVSPSLAACFAGKDASTASDMVEEDLLEVARAGALLLVTANCRMAKSPRSRGVELVLHRAVWLTGS